MTDSEHAARPSTIDVEAMQTAQLLSEFAKLLNCYGPDSSEATAFLRDHETNYEFVELARLSATLKRALSLGKQPS